MTQDSKEKKKWSRAKIRWVLALIGMLSLAVGLVICRFWSWPLLRDAMESKNWVPTECTILSSKVGTHSRDKGTTYSVDIRYAYTVDGQEYTSERYDFMGGSSSGYAAKQRIVSKFPEGSKSTAYVHPADPSQATLVTGFIPSYLLAFLPALFCLSGLWMLAASVFGYRASAEAAALASLEQPSGELKPVAGPLVKIFTWLFLAVFWNGIVFIFVWQLIQEWLHGNKQWFLALFLVPFVLVGAFLIFLIFRSLLQLANPRFVLTLAPLAPLPGDAVRLEWSLKGDPSRISRLRLLLEGRRETIKRSRKSSHTEKTVLHESTLVDTTNPHEARSGAVLFNIPHDAPASFEDYPRKIVWEIKVRATIPGWPDVEDDYVFTVRA